MSIRASEKSLPQRQAWKTKMEAISGDKTAASEARTNDLAKPVPAPALTSPSEHVYSEAVIEPPDGGYGWVIVAACFMSNVIVGGCLFNVGQTFQPTWVEYFRTTPSIVSWVVAFMSAWYYMGGPLISAISSAFGFRVTACIGTTLSVFGFIASVFAPSVTFLYVCFGVLGGLGFGFLFLPTVVIVNYYFKKRRAIANGVAACGTGVGQMLFAPLMTYLNSAYTWREMCLLLAGIVLHCYICAAFYRLLKPTRQQVVRFEKALINYGTTSCDKSVTRDGSIVSAIVTPAFSRQQSLGGYSDVFLPEGVTVNETVGPASPLPLRRFSRSQSITVPAESNLLKRAVSIGVDNQSLESIDRKFLRRISQTSIETINQPFNRKDIFFRGSCRSLQNREAAIIGSDLPECQCVHKKRLQKQQAVDTEILVPQGILQTVKSTLLQMLDVRLFRSLTFLAWSLGGASMAFGLFVPFTYLPKQSRLLGYSVSQSSLLVSVIGVTNIVARIACGWLSDRPKVDAVLVQNVSIFLGGIATVILPHLTVYWMMVIYCIFFGFANACFSSLRSIVCVELLGLNSLTTATGWIFLFLGVANLLGSPTVAYLYDLTGNFKLSFYITGGLMVFSAVLGFCWRRIKAWEKKRKQICRQCSKVRPTDVFVIPETVLEERNGE